MTLKELFFTMEALNLDIILVISKKVKLSGFNSMMKELDNLTQEIFKSIALVENIGGEKAKVLIC